MAVIAIGLLWPPAFRDASDAGPADDPVLFSKEARFITRASAKARDFGGPGFVSATTELAIPSDWITNTAESNMQGYQ